MTVLILPNSVSINRLHVLLYIVSLSLQSIHCVITWDNLAFIDCFGPGLSAGSRAQFFWWFLHVTSLFCSSLPIVPWACPRFSRPICFSPVCQGRVRRSSIYLLPVSADLKFHVFWAKTVSCGCFSCSAPAAPRLWPPAPVFDLRWVRQHFPRCDFCNNDVGYICFLWLWCIVLDVTFHWLIYVVNCIGMASIFWLSLINLVKSTHPVLKIIALLFLF
jgi:hypothetical protein